MNDNNLKSNIEVDNLDYFEQNKKSFDELMIQYKCALMEIENRFKIQNEQFNTYYSRNPIEYIKTRLKSPASIINKVYKYQIELSLESIEKNIFDIAGIRIVTSFIEDIYKLEESFLKQSDIKLVKRKDYIASPKETGYRSLHLVVEVPVRINGEVKNVNVEVQFRTIAMDFWASLEHKIRYKQNLSDEKLSKISDDLALCAAFSHELDIRMQEINDEINEVN